MLSVNHIYVSYGDVEVLRDVSIEVARGEIVAVLGSKGAGKSTLLKALVGLLPLRRGEVTYEGQRISGLGPERLVQMGIALVPEGRQLFPNLSVRDNLLAGAMCRERGARKQALEAVMGLFPPLSPRLHQQVGTMSGGEQQMVAIGRALMSNPRLLLIDEMSLGIAPVIVNRLFSAVSDLRDRGITTVLVEQNANEALRVADRSYILEVGTVVIAGKARDLLGNQKVQRAYLGLGVD